MNLYKIHESYREELTGAFRKLGEMLDRNEIDVTDFLAAQERIYQVYLRKSREMALAV